MNAPPDREATVLLQVDNLRKSYAQPDGGPLQVLDGAAFVLAAGETLAITGQSGSGKSTLMALLAGLDRPDSGRILVAGRDLALMDEAELTRFRAGHIGIVFQQFHLMPHLSAEENVSLPLELLGRPCPPEAIDTLLERVGLGARRRHLPGQLSGGECQRVAIARALAVAPDLLLADEPTGNLDVATGRSVADLLFQLAERERMTMIVVTHNEELAERCTRRLRLARGQLQ
ncbi:MAG: ABC transporter ATP-binding protein [Desulfobulbus sp.]|jgi:putative ABC transport system ATP-binding protein|nr:ABC transporter ATP-binding protein [Desulfobulbus sp.]